MRIVRPELGADAAHRLRDGSLSVLAGSGAAEPGETADVLDDAIALALDIARPAGAWTTLPVLEVRESGVFTRPGLMESPMFARLVSMCEGPVSLVFRVVTIGDAFQLELSRRKPLFDRLVLDAVGSVLVEIVADMVEEEYSRELSARGLESGIRVSPGYCDWPVEGQALVFSALDAGAIGVTLNEKYVMFPLKSHSSVSVVASAVPVSSSCALCGMADCAWRRIPAAKD